MTHHEGTPNKDQNNNGPVQNQVPHSGVHHGEQNVHDFRNPDGSIMSIKDAVRAGKFRKPDGSAYTEDEINSMPDTDTPIGLAPESIADHTDPSTGPKTEAYEPMIGTGKKWKKRHTALLASGAVLLSTIAGVGAVKAFSGNNKYVANPGPVATGPAVAGGTPSADPTDKPTQGPTANENTPVDPESEISQSSQTEQEKQAELRRPYQESPITSVDFTKLLASESTRQLLAEQNGYANLDPGRSPLPDAFPNWQALASLKAEGLLTELANVDTLIETKISDGSFERDIELTNKTYGTNYSLDDFFISPDEIPAARTNANKTEVAAFLAKIVGVGQNLLTVAAAVRHDEYFAKHLMADTPPEQLESTQYITMSQMFGSDRKAPTTSVGVLAGDEPKRYHSDSVVPNSTLLITNVGGTPDHDGYQIESGVSLPMLGIYAQTNETRASIDDESGIANINKTKKTGISYYMLKPMEIGGKKVAFPVSVGVNVFKTVGQ